MINLPSESERRTAISQEFERVGLSYELWPAVNGSAIDVGDLLDLGTYARDSRGLTRMDRGSIACTMSHMEVYRDLVSGSNDIAAIFEDDVTLLPDLPRVLDDLEEKADKFDVLMLCRRWNSIRFVPLYNLPPSYRIGRLRYAARGAYGYVVTKRAAEQLITAYPDPVHEIDRILPRYWENGLDRILYLTPPVVIHQERFSSCIEKTRQENDLLEAFPPLKRSTLFRRRLKDAVRDGLARRRAFRALRKNDTKFNYGMFQSSDL